jgi:hypothetical protein
VHTYVPGSVCIKVLADTYTHTLLPRKSAFRSKCLVTFLTLVRLSVGRSVLPHALLVDAMLAAIPATRLRVAGIGGLGVVSVCSGVVSVVLWCVCEAA